MFYKGQYFEKLNHFERQKMSCVLCFENACKLSVCQKWVFSTKTKRNQKKKKIFMGLIKI
ncbi:hypothetical protein HMPREF1399_01504 [Helicobacter pylori GAM118Bi]|nr:hypothetical protein HMPREF1399_01504 [Helicobacter pylori GAM118Bi]